MHEDPATHDGVQTARDADALGAKRQEAARGRRQSHASRCAGAIVLALLVAVAATATVIQFSPGRDAPGKPGRDIASRRPPVNARRRAAVKRTPAGRGARAAARSPASLPQTHAFPSARTPLFRSLAAALWAGVIHGSVSVAMPAFFRRAAYAQLKTIAGASTDWEQRLVHDFAMDIGAAHRSLGSGAAYATLLRVDVPASFGHWVSPGVCYNSVGYYEVPNARVVYRENGQMRSFGIASMITWRGAWYVVHLGAVLRSSDTGIVDEAASGPGTSMNSATC